MYRAAYLLRVPADKTTIHGFTRPWSQGPDPSGRPHGPLADGSWPVDDLENMPAGPQFLHELDRDREDTREPDYESYWRERDFYDNLEYESQYDQGLTWPERYSWEQYATPHPAFN